MNYYKEEVPNSVVYTTTSYNVNPAQQKGKNRLKLFPRFSRKKAAPQPLVVDHSIKVHQSSYGGVVYPSGYSSEKYQISQQSPGARSNSICINDAVDTINNSERVTYYESNYTPNTFNHEKYYCPPPSVSSYSSSVPPVRSNRVQCQPIQTERLRSYQQQQQQQQQQSHQYAEDSNLINSRQQYNSYGGTNSTTNGQTQININNNINHINEDYNYNSTNNNNNNNNYYNNQQQEYNQPPPSNVDNFIYPPGYLDQQQQQQHSYQYHEENHHYSANQQPCEPVYPMGIEQQNWNFSVQSAANQYNY